MMPAAEQREVQERRRAPVRPVTEMMPLTEADAAAGEAAAPVPMVEGPPQGGGNRPGPGPDLDHPTILIMAHHHPAGVAGQAPGRFRGNAGAVLHDGLARLLRLGQGLGVDMDHHLIALARGAGIEPVVQGRLREESQGIGLPLGHRGRFRGNAPGPGVPVRHACPLVQRLARGGERLQEQCPHFRLEPPPEDHHAVLVLVQVKGPARMPQRGLPGLGPPVHPTPAAYDPLDVSGRPSSRHRQESRFGLGRGHAGDGADLGVRELPASQGLGQERQRLEGARDPNPFAGCAQIKPHPPAQPGGAGAKARVPSPSRVELPDESEEARGGGVQVRGQLGDLVAEPVQLRLRIDLHGMPSFQRGDSTPRFSGFRRASGGDDLGTRNDF